MWHQGFNRNFTKAMRTLFVHKENNKIIYLTILLPELLSSAILESTPERNQCNQHCLRSACACFILNVNNADYVDYILGYSPKWRKTVTQVEECHMNYFTDVLAMFLDLGTLQLCCCLWEGQRALRFHQKHLNLGSENEQRSYGFGTTWGWVINDRILIFGWTNPLMLTSIWCAWVRRIRNRSKNMCCVYIP